MTIISVENLSKSYTLGQIGTGTFSHDLAVWWARARGKPNPLLRIGETDHGNRVGEEIWALKDVSFQVNQGEVLGVIGRNGAGKSTLLKILSRVTAPTSGEVKVKGRIASLLEVGTGFHPELTGRENIFLNGAILGMTKQEVTRKFDEIVDFSGVEKFIDTPVKRYSSGMYVRLAFAVAAHLESEILLVDEVLAVGDAEFQKKCLGKMGDVAHNEGRTVLFVSHNLAAVRRMCEYGLFFNAGKVFEKKPIKLALALFSELPTSNFMQFQSGPIKQIEIIQKEVTLEIKCVCKFPHLINTPILGFAINEIGGETLFAANQKTENCIVKTKFQEGVIKVVIKEPKLRNGKFNLGIWLGDGMKDIYANPQLLTFDIVDSKSNVKPNDADMGSIKPICTWVISDGE